MKEKKDLTVTMIPATHDLEDGIAYFDCPYCAARFEYKEECEGVVIHAPDDIGFLPYGRKNQIGWLISYSLWLLMLGAIAYKYIIGPLL